MKRIRVGLSEPDGPLDPTPDDVRSANRHRWTKEEVALLGTMTDPEVAAKVGVSHQTVFKERKRRRIGAFRTPSPRVTWTKEMIARLGQDSDQRIAHELGQTKENVFRKRRELGIKSAFPDYGEHGHKWTPAEIERLGKAPDLKVAQELELGFSTVRDKRRSLKIPAWRPHPKEIEWTIEMIADLDQMTDAAHAAKYGISSKSSLEYRLLELNKHKGIEVYDWKEDDLKLVGTLPDPQVARQLGCSVQTVVTKRKELGRAPVGPTPIDWTKEMDALLGKVPDAEIARTYDISHGAVALRREKLGIPATPDPRAVRPWTPEEDKLLGTASDVEVGRQIGRTGPACCERRIEKKIPSMTERLKAEREARGE